MKVSARLFVWPDEDRAALEMLVRNTASGLTGQRDAAAASLPKVPDLIERARTLIAQRRVQRQIFGDASHLFQDPAWDILLELYVVPARRPLAVTSVAYAIGVPASTTLRWLRKLQDAALVHSAGDPIDARVRRISLSSRAIEFMDAYLGRI